MRFISSFASGHKLPSQLVKELVSALAYCSKPSVGCFHRVWGTWVSWCQRGGQQMGTVTSPTVEQGLPRWFWHPCFWGILQPVREASSTASGLPYIKSCSQKIVKAGKWFIIQSLHGHFSIQNRSPPLCMCVLWHANILKGIKSSHHFVWDHTYLSAHAFSVFFGKEKLEGGGLNIPAFFKLFL